MPYNNNAILPSEEVTGTTVLPLSRVKKVLAADEDLGPVSSQSAFLIAKATELFIQHLTHTAFTSAKAESKTKRSLTYHDLSHLVARTDYLEFLVDIIPQTTTWRAYKEKKAKDPVTDRPAGSLPAGQTTLDAGPSTAIDSSPQQTLHPSRDGGLILPEEPVNGATHPTDSGYHAPVNEDGDVEMS